VTSVAVVGAEGYVGRAIARALARRADVQLTAVTRSSYETARQGRYDVVVNAAMPAARFKARNDPRWDFVETVQKTADLLYGWELGKLIQVSSVSARCQLDTIYGRHKSAAERMCHPDRDLVVRLGPMYSEDLAKGVLVDMLEGRKVWVDGSSRYCFAPRDWVGQWIADHLDRTGLVEVGARDGLALRDVARHVGADVEFEGPVDHQEIPQPAPDFPAAEGVLAFLQEQARRRAAVAA
jgi:nucleoside-diphosphate-sugar epimerase